MFESIEAIMNYRNSVYTKCGLRMENFSPEAEGAAYGAHTFMFEGRKCLFRVAKKTPRKIGWFVTIWKRAGEGVILPYDQSDDVDFVVVAVSDDNYVGEFVFPKPVLLEKNLFSVGGVGGKRATRLYTPWDNTTSVLAIKAQAWQNEFFVNFDTHNSALREKIRSLYAS